MPWRAASRAPRRAGPPQPRLKSSRCPQVGSREAEILSRMASAPRGAAAEPARLDEGEEGYEGEAYEDED